MAVPEEGLAHYRRLARRHLRGLRSAARSAPRRVLALGSGQSLDIATLLAQAGCLVMAADTIAAEAAPPGHVNVFYNAPYVAGDDALAGWFDLAISHASLQQLGTEELLAVLEECRRLLRPGGVCSFFVEGGEHSVEAFRKAGFEVLQVAPAEERDATGAWFLLRKPYARRAAARQRYRGR